MISAGRGAAASPIRVLVADASRLVRREVGRLLTERGDAEIVASVGDGVAAIDARLACDPDVVVIDLALPKLDGLEAIRWMMGRRPVPIVVFGCAGSRLAAEALGLGVIEILAKPQGPVSLDLEPLAEQLSGAVRRASRIRVVRNALGTFVDAGPAGRSVAAVADEERPTPGPARPVPVVALTASTGGPVALQRVLAELPSTLPAALVVCQHLPPGFTADLAGLLRRVSRLRVEEARDGEMLGAGIVHVAPGGRDLAIVGRCLRLSESPLRACGPSADLLFGSLASSAGESAVAVVLTGMGEDGARGARSIRERGGTVIAQDEASSVVYGMPAAAMRLGGVNLQLPLGEIGPTVARLVTRLAEGRAA